MDQKENCQTEKDIIYGNAVSFLVVFVHSLAAVLWILAVLSNLEAQPITVGVGVLLILTNFAQFWVWVARGIESTKNQRKWEQLVEERVTEKCFESLHHYFGIETDEGKKDSK